MFVLWIRRPPRPTPTATPFPYSTLFRSASEPAEAIADDDAAPHRLRPVLAAAVKGAAEEEERRARFHLDRDRLLVRHRVGVGPMAVRPEAGGAILGGERRQRPDDVQKIFDFAFGTLPHVLNAGSILGGHAGGAFGSLGQVESDPGATWATP